MVCSGYLFSLGCWYSFERGRDVEVFYFNPIDVVDVDVEVDVDVDVDVDIIIMFFFLGCTVSFSSACQCWLSSMFVRAKQVIK